MLDLNTNSLYIQPILAIYCFSVCSLFSVLGATTKSKISNSNRWHAVLFAAGLSCIVHINHNSYTYSLYSPFPCLHMSVECSFNCRIQNSATRRIQTHLLISLVFCFYVFPCSQLLNDIVLHAYFPLVFQKSKSKNSRSVQYSAVEPCTRIEICTRSPFFSLRFVCL